MRGLPAGLPYLYLQRFCIFYPAALRKSFFHIRDRGQRRVSFAQLVFRIGLPIERRIRLRPIQLCKLSEFPRRLVITVFVERLAPIAVKFIEPFQALLLAVALFLRPVARLLLAVAFFLRPILGFLLAILGILILPGSRGPPRAAEGRSWPSPSSLRSHMSVPA